ncbi:MAG TPA: PQQ-binding-like beta-propeller repeat protein [Pseudonocardiaceae bacterium]|nr:PQQ-binding-like beta-propeller repeat protein [Pseudonocardiaceae bacterium]
MKLPLVPVAAVAFCGAGLVTAFIGLRDAIGSASSAKLWLVLFVAAGIAALVLLRTARDDRRRVRLGIGWVVLGAVIVAVAADRTPAPAPGAPLGSGWAVLVAGGAAVLLGGVLLAVSPKLRFAANRALVAVVVVLVCAIQAGGYAGALNWTNGQNVNLSVADARPLRPAESALDGRVRWTSKVNGEQLATAGGVLTTLTNGLQMLDPATGAPRWTYRRADVGAVVNPVTSSDGALVGVVAVEPSLNPKPADHPAMRLLVLDAMTGAVVTDSPLDPRTQGALATIGSTEAYFSGGPDGVRIVQLSGVELTGPRAGQQDWVYVPKDTCQIDMVSALNSEVALSTTCGTVAMLNPDGTPRWTYRAPDGGAVIWPLAGAPAGTVQAVTEPGPVVEQDGLGVSQPRMVVSLDTRTGAVRWQDNDLPAAPFAPDSTDEATGTLTPIWADGTAVLIYNLPASRRIWLFGYRRDGLARTWSVVLPNKQIDLGSAAILGRTYAATPDGRIVLPTQSTASTQYLDAHPGLTVVNGRDGWVTPTVMVNGPRGITDSDRFFGPPEALVTPGGVVLTIYEEPASGPTQTTQLLVGLH